MFHIQQLTSPVSRDNLTNLILVRQNFELPRPHLEKEGYLELWFAYAYFDGENFQEPLHPGVCVKITGQNLVDFLTDNSEPMAEVSAALYDYCINNSLIPAGTKVVVGGE